MTQKRFPADTTLEELTFLNNKRIDAEIYTYFQCCSYPKKNKTIAYKKDLGTQSEICEILRDYGAQLSLATYKRHLNYLIEQGYIIEEKDYYVLPSLFAIAARDFKIYIGYIKDSCYKNLYIFGLEIGVFIY